MKIEVTLCLSVAPFKVDLINKRIMKRNIQIMNSRRNTLRAGLGQLLQTFELDFEKPG